MKIVQLSPGIGKSSYGVGGVIMGLSRALLDSGADIECWCLDSPQEIKEASRLHGVAQNALRGFEIFGPTGIGYSREMERWARNNPPDVIHQHMLWMAPSRVANQIRKTSPDLVSVIAAHGALDTWALRQSRFKKFVASKLYESKNLQQANCYHATSNIEVQDYLRLGLNKPIALIENGVSDACLEISADAHAFRRQYSVADSTRLMVYISRITPKKNIPFLIDTLVECLAFRSAEWMLVIAGDWNNQYGRKVRDYIRSSKISDRVITLDPLWGQPKAEALAAADCVVLPSVSEGNPMILMESLASGVPVIVCNIEICPPLKLCDCGWSIGVSSLKSREILEGILLEPKEIFLQKGRAGKAYVARNLTWSAIAEKAVSLYEWLRGNQKRPNFVLEQ